MTDVKTRGVEKNRQYKSTLTLEVPYCNKSPKHPDFNKDNCWWCQENPRIKIKPDVIIWCNRCYALHFKKHDGTYRRQDTMGIAKDFQDIQAGRVKVIDKLDEPNYKVYQE